MAAELIWSSESLDDMDAIAEFIARGSPHHAQHVVAALFELSDIIATHPLAGRVVPELHNQAVRERFLYSYRVIYEVRAARIEILALLHGRRLLESIGERFEE